MEKHIPTDYFDCQLQRATGFYIWIHSLLIEARGSKDFIYVHKGALGYVRSKAEDSTKYAAACEILNNEYFSTEHIGFLVKYNEKIGQLWDPNKELAANKYNEIIAMQIDELLSDIEQVIETTYSKRYRALFSIEKTALLHLYNKDFVHSYRCFLHLKLKWSQHRYSSI